MKRHWIFSSAVALAGLSPAWGQTPPAVTDPRPAVTFDVQSAPESLVYQFFFAELHAAKLRTEELAAQGKDTRALSEVHLRLTGLEAAEFAILQSLAQETVSAQRAAGRRIQELLEQAATPGARQQAAPELARLRAEAEAAPARAATALRALLGPERFAEFDQRVRRHVVPNLKLYPVSAAGGKPAPGGR